MVVQDVAVQDKAQLIALIQRNQATIRDFGVARLGVFGSFVRDEPQPQSDVDLIVEFEQDEKTFDNFTMNLSFFLEDTLQRRVELLTPESLSPFIGPHILREVEYVPFNG